MSYIIYTFEKYKNQKTRRGRLRQVKGYLRYFKERYSIDELALNRLSVSDKNYEGGNPISKEDLDLIAKEFYKRSKLSVRDELHFIIFALALRTKLRPGEIANLRRGCIVERNSRRIQYYSKVSKDNLQDAFLTEEMILLVERAIEITGPYYNIADEKNREYIFICNSVKNKTRICRISKHFSRRFKEIVDSLEGSLSKGNYTAYCLRDTYINTIYEEGIKLELSIMEISDLAGNGCRTAIKNYRDNEALVKYAEAFSGVTVTDVDIEGNILESEDELEEFDIVLEGAGGCKEKSICTFSMIKGIEDQYACLKCKSFITCVSRIPVFKRKIKELNVKLDNSENDEEIEFINAQLQLFGAYHAALLGKKGIR